MSDFADFFVTNRIPLDWDEPSPEERLGTVERVPLEPTATAPLDAEDCLCDEVFDDNAAYESIFQQRVLGLDIPALCEKQNTLSLKSKFLQQQRTPQLSDPKNGLPSRAQQRALSEIAQALADTGQFRNIDGRLYQFCDSCWKIRLVAEVDDFLPSIVRQLFPEYIDCVSTRNYHEIFMQLRSRVVRESMAEIEQDNQQYLCCEDGVYRLSDGQIFPPDPGLNLFYHLNLSVYDIGRGSEYYTERFLQNATNGDITLRERILQMIAVIVTAMPLKCFFFLEGEGNTGKSQLIKFLESLLGEGACYSLPSINALSERWTLGGLVDKLMCSCPDIPKHTLGGKTIACIKQIAGDDRVRGELKGVDPFSFDCNAKLVFGSNHPLNLSHPEQEEALLKRLVYIPFHNPVPESEQIPQLFRHLYDEAGYIVGLALEQRKKLLENNGVFTALSDDIESVAYARPADEQLICSFVENYCQLDPAEKTPVGELYEAFCQSTRFEIERSRFSYLLLQLPFGLTRDRSNSARYVKGIRVSVHENQS